MREFRAVVHLSSRRRRFEEQLGSRTHGEYERDAGLRTAQPRSDERGELRWREEDVSRLVQAALGLAEARPSTKTGVALVRDARRRQRGNRASDEDARPRHESS